MKLSTVIFSVAMLASGMASAQSSADSVRSQLTNMGYSNVQVNRSGNVYSVAAQRDGQTRLITYDAITGQILSDESVKSTGGGLVNGVIIGNVTGSIIGGGDSDGGNDNDD